ncbi:hypothetical protein [Paractinoplanes rishiriensis]|uniref:hypothetical protein n=1 Tax=Paractinoplanes rishiriensis TaxID=1050105 RepID=UPI001945200A|nr:hypothetical protein [Actinoplanes rishiriensis]
MPGDYGPELVDDVCTVAGEPWAATQEPSLDSGVSWSVTWKRRDGLVPVGAAAATI